MAETIDIKKEELVKEMFKVGAQFGHSKSGRHSSTKPFIYGFKSQTAIIDLEKTVDQLEAAKAFAFELGRDKKILLFVGTKKEAVQTVQQTAESAGQPYVIERWIGGTLTNFKEIRKRVERMEELRSKSEKGELSVYTKKERGVLAKELSDLERYFSGIESLTRMPGAVFVIGSKKETIAVDEAIKLGIPVIALCSSDCDVNKIAYPVVANDSSAQSIAYFAKQIADAYKEGSQSAKEEPAKEAPKEV